MKKTLTLITMIIISSLTFSSSSAKPSNISSGFEYWTQADGDTIQYNVFTTPAKWYPATMEIVELVGQVYQNNFLITTSIYGTGDFMSFVHAPGTPASPIVGIPQINGTAFYNGKCFIGEVRNGGGNVMYPPEPKLTCNPIVGESFDVYSTVFESETDRTIVIPSFKTRYRTIRKSSYLPLYPDVLVTAIAEYNPDGTVGWVGNYYYAKGVGIILQYGGFVKPDGTIDAIKLFKNP